MPCHEGGLGFTGNPSLFSGMLDCFHSRGWAHCRSSPGGWVTCTWHSIMLALPPSAWKNVPMNYYKHWYCDQPTTGYGCCWKTQHLISKTCWWPIVYGQMRTSSSGLVTPVLVPNNLLKHHSVSCTPLPIPPVLGSLCVNGFPGRSVPLAESHPISPRWVTSPSVPPPKGCHELLILPTMLWCCGLSDSILQSSSQPYFRRRSWAPSQCKTTLQRPEINRLMEKGLPGFISDLFSHFVLSDDHSAVGTCLQPGPAKVIQDNDDSACPWGLS